jgi:LmbE family N-acetylglucosaminyl deacetylase
VDDLEALKIQSMLRLNFELGKPELSLLCIGAHSDDLEIGCGGTVLEWLIKYTQVEATWVVLSAPGQRAVEARDSANELLRKAKRTNVVVRDFRDGYFPAEFDKAKILFEELKASEKPDIILTHHLEDRHQDHRLVAELTWQTFRDHLILEYEIPKYEGCLGQPNVYVSLSGVTAHRKIDLLLAYFGTQRSRGWFKAETFNSLMRLRAIECRSESGFAEAFHVRKFMI